MTRAAKDRQYMVVLAMNLYLRELRSRGGAGPAQLWRFWGVPGVVVYCRL